MLDLSTFGLIALVIGWIIQFFSTSSKKHEFNPLFLIFYALGAGILAWDSFHYSHITAAVLNLATFVLPIAILLKISK